LSTVNSPRIAVTPLSLTLKPGTDALARVIAVTRARRLPVLDVTYSVHAGQAGLLLRLACGVADAGLAARQMERLVDVWTVEVRG
jgi:acetolactate synthase regulatory subunit